MSSQTPVRVFYSYSHRDERYRVELEKSLKLMKREGAIVDWSDRKIEAGGNIDAEIDNHLEQAQVILLLVSRDFLHSDYCYGKEMTRALQRDEAGAAKVIPIIVRACEWQRTPLAKLKAIPKDGKPIGEWRSQDRAWLDVSTEIRNAIANFSHTETIIPVPVIPSTPVGPGEPGAPRPAHGTIPDSLFRGRLPDTEIQLIPLGRPNNKQDGWPGTLSLALNASKTRIAYTRLEPVNVYYKARMVAVEEAPSGEWWIHQWLLAEHRYEGWPMADYRDAAAFAVRQLAVPDGQVWWAASGLLSVMYDSGLCYPDSSFLKDAVNALVPEGVSSYRDIKDIFGEPLEDDAPTPIEELSECWYSVLDDVKKRHPGADQLEDRFYVENITDGVIGYSTYGKDIGKVTLHVLGQVIAEYVGVHYKFKHIHYLSPKDAYGAIWPLTDDAR